MRLTRITLLIIALIIGSGVYLLVRRQLDEVEPQTFQATEEAMVDTSNILAALIEADLEQGEFQADRLEMTFDKAEARTFKSKIYTHLKTHVDAGIYVTDAKGIVIFDSRYPERIGRNFSAKRDVFLTLRGEYGARSSRAVEDDDTTSVFFVAAPIYHDGQLWGVISLYKPQADVLPIVRRRRSEIWWGTGLIGGGILFLVAAVFIWQYRPIGRLTEYARAIEQGRRPSLPSLGAGREVNTLARALESMREALEGRNYAERYVQTLTHEMKSPIAAIRGAAELLDEQMPPKDRQRFLTNIRAESARADRLLSRLLELSALEGKTRLDDAEPLDFREVVTRAIDQAKPLAELAGVTVVVALPAEPVRVVGDSFILRAAVTNLLENAIDFSPGGDEVRVNLARAQDVILSIEDHGPGIPDYARKRIFERFFSLRHLKAGRKGTGLGLTLVKEAAELHGGEIRLNEVEPTGTRATLQLPSARDA